MMLRDLVDTEWKSYERKRFLKDDTKSKTDEFDPESFKYDGFSDREKFFEEYVPALADDARLRTELNDFMPPRVDSINNSAYQALVIRYGILRQLIQQQDYNMPKDALLDAVQAWQQHLIENFDEVEFAAADDLLHLAKAAIDYKSDIDDSELHMIYSYFELHNRAHDSKHDFYTWLDFFKRLAAIDRFPKVSRSDRPEHARDTIEMGLWSLQEQAIVYEISNHGHSELVGLPEEYAEFVQDWLYYEMSETNYLQMLETLEPFDKQATLVNARNTFGIETRTHGRNQERRESLVKAGVFPSDLLRIALTKDELKQTVDRYGLDAHKQKTEEMIAAIIDYFEQSQKSVGETNSLVQLYLESYEDIADGSVTKIPPQLQELVGTDTPTEKLDILFEKATALIFEEVFNLEGTTLLGQQASGVVADGEVEQDGQWLLWDNKRRQDKFRLGSTARSKIKNYIDTKNDQHNVEWFVIIAPEFTQQAVTNAEQLEMQVGEDIRLIRAAEFARLATMWQAHYAEADRELPLSIFYGSNRFSIEAAEAALDRMFS